MSLVRFLALSALFFPSVAEASAGNDREHREAVRSWVAEHRSNILDELTRFVALPNVSKDHDDLEVNAEHLLRMLERRGLETKRLETETAPYLFARLAPEAPSAGSRPPVVLFYAHYDGQPVDPDRWTVGKPFVPTLRGNPSDPEARLYARSASDDKAPIVGLLTAIDALRELGFPPNIEAKFLFDPEEEIGSPQLPAVVERHAELLQADLMIFVDGPVHQSLRPTVVFGTRGIVTVTLTVYGPARPLHSGHYGNWAPNPAEKLARLLASMKDADGRVTIEGFYDDVVPLSERGKAALAAIPAIDDELGGELLLPRRYGAGKSLQELINLPSLNVRGMASAWVGDRVRTIIPDTATAEIDLRLVKGVEPDAQVRRLVEHVRKQGFHVVDNPPDAEVRGRFPDVAQITRRDAGRPAIRTPMDTPWSRSVITAVRRAVEVEPVLMPTLGGTLPIYPLQEKLGLPIYGVPVVNPDNNQHAPDENLRIANLWYGIDLYAALLTMP